MKICLLRHTESTSNKANKADSQIDADLTEKGLKDAEELISTLNKYKFDIFVVSPLKRTIQTIQLFLDTFNNPKIITSELTLERDLGEFTGTQMGTFQKYCDDNKLNRVTCRPKGGESILDVYKRAETFLSEIKENYLNKTVLVCSSKNFLLCLEIAIRGKKIQDFYSFKPLELGELREFKYKHKF